MSQPSQCGLCGYYPKWLKNSATTRNFICVYSFLGTIQAMAFIYIVVTLTTLEKRFKIPSQTTGIILSGNEISQSLSMVLTYYAGSGHRPKWISVGVACSALSCWVLASPHFIYGAGKDAMALTKEFLNQTLLNNTVESSLPLCPSQGSSNSCDEEAEADVSFVPRLLIFLSQFILGIGTTLYYGLGQTYLDDNTKKKNTPLLLGITYALRTIGPVIGFVLGYACLSLYIDPSLHPVIEKDDPRWLGAWWLGWIILGAAMGTFAFLMAMFPKDLVKAKKKNDDDNVVDEIQLKEKNKEIVEQAPEPSLKDFAKAFKRILSNRILSCNNVSAVFYILGASAYITFLAKYLEVQYSTSPGGGTMISGPITLFGMVMGFMMSGWFISKFKPGPRSLLGWNVMVGIFFVIGQLAFIFMSCEGAKMQGFDSESMQINLTSSCNADCNCENKYDPVCHEQTMTTFFSACHAGCRNVLNDQGEFTNCSCIEELVHPETMDSKDVYQLDLSTGNIINKVKNGVCPIDCKIPFLTFTIITCLVQTLACSGRIGNVLVNYRCVAKEDKSFAQGVTIMIISLFALIPGPIIYGAIIDSTCLVWDYSCGEKGNCWFYDKDSFRYYVNIAAASMTSVGVMFDIVVWYLGKNLDLYGDDDDDKRRDFIKDDFPGIAKEKSKYYTQENGFNNNVKNNADAIFKKIDEQLEKEQKTKNNTERRDSKTDQHLHSEHNHDIPN